MSPYANLNELENKEAIFIVQVQTVEEWLTFYVGQAKELKDTILSLYLVNENEGAIRNNLLHYNCRLVFCYIRSEQLRIGIENYLNSYFELRQNEISTTAAIPVNLDFN